MTQLTDNTVKRWERHSSSIMGLVAVALLMWIFSTVNALATDVAVIKVKLATAVDIQASLNAMGKDHAVMAVSMQQLRSRIKRIEVEQGAEDVRERKEHGGNL